MSSIDTYIDKIFSINKKKVTKPTLKSWFMNIEQGVKKVIKGNPYAVIMSTFQKKLKNKGFMLPEGEVILLSFKEYLSEQIMEENGAIASGIVVYTNDKKVFMIKPHDFVSGIGEDGKEHGTPQAWSYPKGLLSVPNKLQNAIKEFYEETGIKLPEDYTLYQKLIERKINGKLLCFWAFKTDKPESFVYIKPQASNPEHESRFMWNFVNPITGEHVPISETDTAEFKTLEFAKSNQTSKNVRWIAEEIEKL